MLQAEPPARVRVFLSVVSSAVFYRFTNVILWENGSLSYIVT